MLARQVCFTRPICVAIILCIAAWICPAQGQTPLFIGELNVKITNAPQNASITVSAQKAVFGSRNDWYPEINGRWDYYSGGSTLYCDFIDRAGRPNHDTIGYGQYRVTCMSNYYVDIDYRDADYPTAVYPSVDLYLYFDNSTHTWTYKTGGSQEHPLANQTTMRIWDFWFSEGDHPRIPATVRCYLNGGYSGTVVIDQTTHSSPCQTIWTLGSHIIAAPAIQGGSWVFDHWSDGGAATHTVSVGEDQFATVFTAYYRHELLGPGSASPVLTASAGVDQHNRKSNTTASPTGYIQSLWLDLNHVKIHPTNRGGLEIVPEAGIGGAFWPETTDMYKDVILFDFGPWVLGKVNGVPKMGLSQWGTSYSPGPVINGKAAMYAKPSDSLRYRLYKITKGDNASTNPDYRDWPADLGAPLDAQGNPRLYGDQTVWSVFNNLDTLAPDWWRTHMPMPGLPVEIQQTLYEQRIPAGDPNALLGNVAFLEWKIINVGSAPIESTYISLWTDIDFNDPVDNLPAIDTIDQLGYCWQGGDNSYYTPPRAVGFVWLYGPSVPSAGSQAVFKGTLRADYKNLPISSFWGIQDDSFPDSSFRGPAYSMGTAWNIARGFDKAGNPIVDSVTHQVTKFPYSGDPVTGSGWLSPWSGGGAGFNLFSGPFTLAPHDTQWVMAALIPVSNADRLECVRLVRQHAATLRSTSYQSIVVSSVPNRGPVTVPQRSALEQNYPNPFNPSAVIKYTIAGVGDVSLVVYDILGREVVVLVNEKKGPGTYQVTFDGTGLAGGVYFYRMTAGSFTQTKRMVLVR